MKKNLSDELTLLTSKLMLCNSKREIIGLSNEFGQLIEKVIEQEKMGYTPERITQEKSVTATIKFTKSEVANMAQTFKKEFIANGLVARIIKRQSGKRTFVYEIRYRRNGYNITASSTDLNEAKRKFLDMTRPENIGHYTKSLRYLGPRQYTFEDIVYEWLTYRQGKITETVYKNQESYCRRYLLPTLGRKPITSIRTIEIDFILRDTSPRLYEDLRTVFNSIFKYAIASGVITHNPVALIQFKKAERTPRRALSKEEQIFLEKQLNLPEFSEYKQTFLIMLYFGLRPCELNDRRFENGFLIARNAKRKQGKIEYKKIPVPTQAREKLNLKEDIVKEHRTDVLNRIFKRIMKNEEITQYSLRHTFATTCQKFIRPDIVDIWMGDSSERLVGRVYTHFPDEFMQEQMEKVIFDI